MAEFVFILHVPHYDDFPPLVNEAMHAAGPFGGHIYYDADRNRARCPWVKQRPWNEQDVFHADAVSVSFFASVEKGKTVRSGKNNAIEALHDFSAGPAAVCYHAASCGAATMFKTHAGLPKLAAGAVHDANVPDAEVWPVCSDVLLFGKLKLFPSNVGLLAADIGLSPHKAPRRFHNLVLTTEDERLVADDEQRQDADSSTQHRYYNGYAIAIIGLWAVGGFLAPFGLHGLLCCYDSCSCWRAKPKSGA